MIGGGITGAAVARDAAMRGFRTLLVDRGDLAGGTSSRSSRLIHGGLRYLEHGHLRLVAEALAERAVLLRIAPHLVHPLPFVVPTHVGDRVPRWKLAIGMWLYDLLAWHSNLGRHRMLSKRAIAAAEPALRQKGLTGGARYVDAQCDDARLVVATARSAALHGAEIRTWTAVRGLVRDGDRVRGAVLAPVHGEGESTVMARVVVNATGPWCDALRRLEDPAAVPLLAPTKGAHVVVPRNRLGHRDAITFTSAVDGRVMFALPWGELSIVGTTETAAATEPGAEEADGADLRYLLRSANACFPAARLGEEDVLATWAGLRPLLAADDANAASREHRIVEGTGGMVTVAGGKLTTHRRMAAEAVDLVARRIARETRTPRRRRPPTDRAPLPGGDAHDLAPLAALGRQAGLGEATIAHCLRHYGSEATAIFNLVQRDRSLGEPLHPEHPAIAAEVVHHAEREFARSVEDVLVRRIHLAHETRDRGAAAASAVAGLLGDVLGWDVTRRAVETARYLASARRPTPRAT